MKLLIAIDHHFLRGSDGGVYLGPPTAIAGYRFWEQYLGVFENVVVLARVKQAKPEVFIRADGPGVDFHDLPDCLGPWQCLCRLAAMKRSVRVAVAAADALILRVPGAIGRVVWKAVRNQGKPYAVDVVADPWDMYSPGAVPGVVRPVLRRLWSRELRQMCQGASVASYVTREALQKRYPPGPATWATYVSDVDLKNGTAAARNLQARRERLMEIFSDDKAKRHRVRIGFLGAFAQMYKAPDVLLYAAADLLSRGIELEVVLVGGGKYKESMERLARKLGLADQVRFLGVLPPGRAVEDFLDQVDLFVLPSRQEGLPRAMIEAMARGCPCIGSSVGGIPELLALEDLVPPHDVAGLARKIQEVLRDRERMERMAKRNWEKAKEYLPDALAERRRAFYRRVREEAEPGRGSLAGLTGEA